MLTLLMFLMLLMLLMLLKKMMLIGLAKPNHFARLVRVIAFNRTTDYPTFLETLFPFFSCRLAFYSGSVAWLSLNWPSDHVFHGRMQMRFVLFRLHGRFNRSKKTPNRASETATKTKTCSSCKLRNPINLDWDQQMNWFTRMSHQRWPPCGGQSCIEPGRLCWHINDHRNRRYLLVVTIKVRVWHIEFEIEQLTWLCCFELKVERDLRPRVRSWSFRFCPKLTSFFNPIWFSHTFSNGKRKKEEDKQFSPLHSTHNQVWHLYHFCMSLVFHFSFWRVRRQVLRRPVESERSKKESKRDRKRDMQINYNAC